MTEPVLAIRDLELTFGRWRRSKVLHGVSLHVRAGEKVALVGESGSGKSVTARLAMGLLQETGNVDVAGSIRVDGVEAAAGGRQIRRLRGRRVAMIFQDPTSALNPAFRIRGQFREVLRTAEPGLSDREADARAEAALAEVSIPDPVRALNSYAFQLSGGMNQRVMIAMALANRPSLLLADEPGTALDVTVQAQTLELMRDLAATRGTAVLLISHNLGVVREFADRVYVIYRGRIVEHARTAQLFSDPRHPYTRALLAAIPKISGGGLPDLPERSPDFENPRIVHEGCAEPWELRP
ncbi:D-ala-D-ala transporter subunit; ATP-binding component of ABC superfamily [uncultured Pleomorphomonas sp.]|uniref:D-ala-D-ala transporter subunit ATP-binding component of ABC superfamily n=1 Tax=uncultured Pleomorphomonas sp. TaxID=442121 RepID=A0A212LFH1_9HYPH|nr:ABC transporter ATP-binding protein [uncultured Pleomorphomonas sp.]SCM76314.1 D-ala-D-ala transporter subunit; ATP-binding component of ABC superfamily [uncultured Pleomorphomonas sp.]